MALRPVNPLGRRVAPVTPGRPGHLPNRVHGATACSFVHIGDARPAAVFDVLARVLPAQEPRVTCAGNITDLDEKNIAAAAQETNPTPSLRASPRSITPPSPGRAAPG